MDKAGHRVEMHKLASSLRARGKPTWSYTLYIKHLFTNGNTDDEAATVAGKIAAAIRSFSVGRGFLDDATDAFDSELEEIVWRFEDIAKAPTDGAQDETNDALDELYTWADYKRCWIE